MIKTSFIFSLAISSLIFSNTSDEKLDKILDNQESIKKDVEIIKKKTTEVSPISSKTFGIELNPFWLLYAGDNEFEGTHLTGGVQLFSIDRNAEISIPFIIHDAKSFSEYSLDLNYKRFLAKTQHGFFINAFTRISKIEANVLTGSFSLDEGSSIESSQFNDTRLGLGFGLGYRVYSEFGLYWGFGIGLGKFFIYEEPEDEMFDLGIFNSTSNFIFDIELMKFGFAF